MPDKPWFRAKRIGWGWSPNSWQGWTVMAVAVAAIVALARLAH